MIPLLDTHLHLIDPARFRYPWTRDVPALAGPFTLEGYEDAVRGSGIAGALFMEADVHEADAEAEARFFAAYSEASGTRLRGVVAAARPERDDFEAQLDRIDGPRLAGIRRVLHVLDDAVSQTTVFRKNLRSLACRQLPFDLCVLPRQHTIGLALVDACPDTRFVLDHCGIPDLSDPAGFPAWHRSIRQFAMRPQVSVKLSGMVASSPVKPATLDQVRPYLDASLEAFGVGRCVWGSDWPVCTLTTGLGEWVALFREWLGGLSETEQARVAHRNAEAIYRLAPLPVGTA